MARMKTMRVEIGSSLDVLQNIREEEATADMAAKAQSLQERLGHTIDVLRKGQAMNSADLATLKDVQSFLATLQPQDEETAAREEFLDQVAPGREKHLTEQVRDTRQSGRSTRSTSSTRPEPNGAVPKSRAEFIRKIKGAA